jgi:signal transduction histidine kinase
MTAPSLPSTDSGVLAQLAQHASDRIRIGHLFLDLRRRRLRFLNADARRLHEEGIPFTSGELAKRPLHMPDGRAVTSTDLPLTRAWRKGEKATAQFLWPRDNAVVWSVTWTAIPLRDAKERMLGVVASVTCSPPELDIRLMAELAHDLRTPLQSLRLLCSLVERMPQVDPELQRTLESLRAAADRAVQVALELLECCRGPVQKSTRANLDWFNLSAFLESLAGEQAAAAQAKNLSMTTDFTAAQGWQVRSDRSRLGRVLANLLVNAIRYTPHGRVTFRATWRVEASRRRLALSVADTGPGISQEEQESIFQPFERGRAGKESDSGGSGLGLAVVDRLVEELGLSLEVYSEYGHGSTFHLLVPDLLLRPVDIPA